MTEVGKEVVWHRNEHRLVELSPDDPRYVALKMLSSSYILFYKLRKETRDSHMMLVTVQCNVLGH